MLQYVQKTIIDCKELICSSGGGMARLRRTHRSVGAHW
mgnify:FL=1